MSNGFYRREIGILAGELGGRKWRENLAGENGGKENGREKMAGEICTGQLRGRIVAGKQGKGPKPATRKRREQLTAKLINWRKENRERESLSDCWSYSMSGKQTDRAGNSD